MRKLLCLFFIPFCMSCIWDRDTLKEEGEGRMEAVEVIVGWFDRYPPEYYETRLARVRGELATNPTDLALYDDAGVALDRLHRSDEAIDMMVQKKTAMNGLEGTASKETLWEHHYRYLANLGTFYVHRWIGREKEARNADLSDLAKAEELIAAAIEHNPEAHFGREKYQLLAIRWLQRDGKDLEGPIGKIYDVEDPEEALRGFLGMIKLGAAWESTDFFYTVGELLGAEQRGVLASAAQLRVDELEELGRGSLHPHEKEVNFFIMPSTDSDRRQQVEDWYSKARVAADERQERRWTHLRKGIADGRHPDTDPHFWKEWKEPKFPELPGMTLRDLESPKIIIAICSGLLIALLIILWLISFTRRRRRKRRLESIKTVGMDSTPK